MILDGSTYMQILDRCQHSRITRVLPVSGFGEPVSGRTTILASQLRIISSRRDVESSSNKDVVVAVLDVRSAATYAEILQQRIYMEFNYRRIRYSFPCRSYFINENLTFGI